MKKQFDQLDHKIIQALHNDARLSASQIARNLDANERTIRKRIDRLVRLGAIRLTAIIDPEAFGYLTAVDIFLDVDADKEDEVIKEFLNTPDVSYIAFGEGTKDLSIECRFKTNEDLREFIRKKIPTIEGVQIRGYSLVPRIIRNIDEWMPRDSDFSIEREEEDDF
ncbi:MAG TPA: Lrp/AsnC family transcriptional regulator [Anaerolineaceae bacterium]|jgi:DNA-binding Lrp family transcriptional regulator|nr:Lrp/AsnC family transcriptional regulator [Anaerolineaceae bacterium]